MAGRLEIGTQFWPWDSCVDIMAYAKKAIDTYPFDCIWFCDEYQYEDSLTMMAVLAKELDVSVGTLVTFPWRNPLDLAQRFATIGKMSHSGKQVSIGLGLGGTVQIQVLGERQISVALFEESVRLLRGQLAGEAMELSEFPKLAARFRYNMDTKAKLYFPPPAGRAPVFVAAGGPKTCAVAGRHGDGVILTQLVGRTAPPAIKRGFLKQALDQVEAAASEAGRTRPLKKVYVGHISVSRDGKAAREWAKRNTSYGLAEVYIRDRERLDVLDIPAEEVAPIAQAYIDGLGVDEAAKRVSDAVLRQAGFVFAGTPDDCIEPVRQLKRDIVELGFEHLVFGVPLGPDIPEALELLAKEVIPAVMA